jgi:hypothetical protein
LKWKNIAVGLCLWMAYTLCSAAYSTINPFFPQIVSGLCSFTTLREGGGLITHHNIIEGACYSHVEILRGHAAIHMWPLRHTTIHSSTNSPPPPSPPPPPPPPPHTHQSSSLLVLRISLTYKYTKSTSYIATSTCVLCQFPGFHSLAI